MDNLIGGRIREFRIAQGWEVSRLAAESRVPEQTIRSWESGTRTSPGVDGVAKVAHALGVTVDDLLGDAPATVDAGS